MRKKEALKNAVSLKTFYICQAALLVLLVAAIAILIVAM